MTRSFNEIAQPIFLGIEGGGTHTVAIAADSSRKLIKRFETGPANVRLLSDAQLIALLKSIAAAALPFPASLGIGLAGARTETELKQIRQAAEQIWPGVPCFATNDLATALAAAETEATNRVLVLSGTGSCCYGVNAAGKTAKIGGWGHILGDKGSGYEIGLRALKAVVFYFDRDQAWPKLGVRLLHRLQLNEPNDLIAWVQTADKSQIAILAIEVFGAAAQGDKIANDILDGAVASLAADALACAHHLTHSKTPVYFVLAGSVLLKQPAFANRLSKRLRKEWPTSTIAPLRREGAWGAVAIAEKNWPGTNAINGTNRVVNKVLKPEKTAVPEMPLSLLVKSSPTEQRNPRSLNLDKLSVEKAIELFLSEDAKIPPAILKEKKPIAAAVKLISHAFKNGGRLFYIGAGTSGRLGVLDASECPPTFRSDPELVQGIMAGGQGALWRSVEGAEDDPTAGATAIRFRNLTKRDVLVGIAASGRTPYVWGAFAEAKRRKAKTVLVALNPFLEISASQRPDVIVTPNVGPEILTGSTRLKSGTATKLILNIFTTLAMVSIGKVESNLMVDLNPSNIKLRDRAIRIVRDLRTVDYSTAQEALIAGKWVIKAACAIIDRSRSRKKIKAT